MQAAKDILFQAMLRQEQEPNPIWHEQVRGFIVIDHAMEYLKDPEAYRKQAEAMLQPVTP